LATNRPYRLSADIVTADRAAVTAVKKLKDFVAVNPDHRVEALEALDERVSQAWANEVLAKNDLDAARDETTAAEWALHDAVLGLKAQVIAQYGPDSNAVASMGLKKKFKRQRGGPRSQAEPAPAEAE
jgi:hypothetical protein